MKYLILGALSSSFMVFGIALIWGTTGELNFTEARRRRAAICRQAGSSCSECCWFWLASVSRSPRFRFRFGHRMFIKARRRRPLPSCHRLQGRRIRLLLRVLFTAVPGDGTLGESAHRHFRHHDSLRQPLRDPQRNIKRLLGYSSIAHAGYLLLGVAALSASGQSALMYYLAGYVFTVMAAFFVITLVMRHLATEDISGLAGLNQRSPLLAATLTVARFR